MVDPGLFLMVKAPGKHPFKATAEAVRGLADRTVTFDRQTFDLDLSSIELSTASSEHRWVLREPSTAILLAGGRSTRMQRDKSLLPVCDIPLIKHVHDLLAPYLDNIVVSAAESTKYSFMNVPVITDRIQDIGPLMGVASCLAASAHELNFVIACDIPDPDIHLVHSMFDQAADYDVVVPRGPTGLPEPLFAVYRKSLAHAAQELIDRGERRMRSLFDSARVLYVDIPEHRLPRNLNTIEDYTGYTSPRCDASV